MCIRDRIQIDEAFAAENVLRRAIIETPTAVSVCAFVRQGLGLALSLIHI